MTQTTTLATLKRLRERQRDTARAALAAAHLTLATFEAKRRAWRGAAKAECATAAALDCMAWLEAARTREWRGAAEADRLRQTVAEADAHHRAADLALEQIIQMQKRQAERAKDQAARHLQHRIDDMRRTDPDDGMEVWQGRGW